MNGVKDNLFSIINAHFKEISETTTLLFIFVFGTVMLARYSNGDEVARWIESGTVIAIIARGYGAGSNKSAPKPGDPAAPPPNEPNPNPTTTTSEKPQP